MFDRATFERGGESGVAEYDVRVSASAEHYITSLQGTLVQELILILPDSTGGSGDSGDSARSVGNQGNRLCARVQRR